MMALMKLLGIHSRISRVAGKLRMRSPKTLALMKILIWKLLQRKRRKRMRKTNKIKILGKKLRKLKQKFPKWILFKELKTLP